jgi:hypothetical protein
MQGELQRHGSYSVVVQRAREESVILGKDTRRPIVILEY